MECLPHEDEGIVDGSFQGDIKAARNELIYRKHIKRVRLMLIKMNMVYTK